MKKFILFILLFSNISLANTNTSTGEFKLPTTDGLTYLTGQIDLPSKKKNLPLVVMVPGTGLFDRDVFWGNSKTKNDLVFKSIASELLKNGFAVLRYDYRGIRCNQATVKKGSSIKACFNNSVRKVVTPQNIRQDIEVVYDWGSKQQNIDPNNIIVFGHSEGSVHLSYLIKNKQITPKSIIFMGGLAESPYSIIKWQMTNRILNTLFSLDLNNDNILTNKEITDGYLETYLKLAPLDQLLSESGTFKRNELKQILTHQYQELLNNVLSSNDDKPFGSGGIIQASYKWWKMFFSDKNNVIENLSEFNGSITYHLGDIDSQVDFKRQVTLIKDVQHLLKSKPNIIRHHDMGHGLGNDYTLGPISKLSMKKLINSIKNSMN